jgi:nucleotide-binding universal stress UspA family protein
MIKTSKKYNIFIKAKSTVFGRFSLPLFLYIMINSMKTILAPTDFSDNALIAVQHAIRLAQATGQRVKLFHSYIKFYAGYDGGKITEKLINQSSQETKELMNTLLHQLQQKYPDVEIVGECAGGYAADSIIDTIRNNAYSVVVMGSKGATSAVDKLLGSTTYGVITKTPIPILVIPQNAGEFALDRIGFFSTYQEADITALLRLRHLLGSPINLQMIHLYTSSQEPIAEAKRWEIKISTEFPDEQFSFRNARVTGINAEVVEQIAKNDKLDLLVFNRIHRPALKKIMSRSLTRDVANHISTPTLFING